MATTYHLKRKTYGLMDVVEVAVNPVAATQKKLDEKSIEETGKPMPKTPFGILG